MFSLSKTIFRSPLLALIFGLSVLPIFAQQKAPIKVACIGNSITYGVGTSNRDSLAYPVQLQRLLGSHYQVGSFGHSGATLLRYGHKPYMAQQAFQDALRFAGDLVVIHLGVNDTDPRNWPNYGDEFVRDYLTLIDTLRSANPKAKFYIALTTPLWERHHRFLSGTRDWQGQINEAIRIVARQSGVQLFDLHTPLYDRPELFPDAVHPNDEGASIIAREVYQTLTGDYGGLQLSSLYTDHMVLQRDRNLDLHGIANAGEEVTISFDKQTVKVRTGQDGRWTAVLKPLKASGQGRTLTIATPQRRLSFEDVVVGEVWLCSGQSNMEFELNRSVGGKEAVEHSTDSALRLYSMIAQWRTDNVAWTKSALDSINHLQYYKSTQWMVASPKSTSDFSAVAYHFGRMLRDSLQVPVGLISNAIGGSTTESWIDRHTLEYQFPEILTNWSQNDFVQDWVRKRAGYNIQLSDNKLQRHPFQPAYLYESGIIPLDRYPIRGVIWYQGESNAHNHEAYERLFPMLVQSWRETWKQPDLPFYFAQLSSIERPSWPKFRDLQRILAQRIPNTGMAVTSDLGDRKDVHPQDKKPVGERLARLALYNTYSRKTIVPQGPAVVEARRSGQAVLLRLRYAEGLKTSDGKPFATFEVAEEDGLFYPATARVVRGGLLVESEAVKHPRYIRYGWQAYSLGNVVNAVGLPMSTFRLEVKSK